MHVSVLRADESGVTLEAPLEPNLNHRYTAFGGSVAALLMIAGWALVHERLAEEDIDGAHTVIQTSEVRYVAPAHGPFRATCPAPEPEEWSRFVRTFRRRGRARILIEGEVTSRGVLAATFRGAYATLGAEGTA